MIFFESSTTQIISESRDESLQISHISFSVILPQIEHFFIFNFTSTIAFENELISSSDIFITAKDNLSAVFSPMLGNFLKESMSTFKLSG